MRKYYRLVVTAIAIISICCFIFYKHQYDELSEIFQGMGFHTLARLEHQTVDSIEAISLWQPVGNLYVKTAYLIDSEILFIGLTSGFMSSKVCDVHGRNNTLWNISVQYDFFSIKSMQNDFRIVLVKCNISSVSDKLSSVSSIVVRDEDTHESARIPVEDAEFQYVHNSLSICVKNNLPNGDFDLIQNVEFLAYHAAIGIKDFFFYTKGFSGEIGSALSILQKVLGISIHIVPWNSPASDSVIDNTAVILDCLLKTTGKSQWAVMLASNQVLHYPVESTLVNILRMKSESFNVSLLNSPCARNLTETERKVKIFRVQDGQNLRALVEGKASPPSDKDPLDLHIVDIENCKGDLFKNYFWQTDMNVKSITEFFLSEYYHLVL